MLWFMTVKTQIPPLKLGPMWERGSQKGCENSLISCLPCFTSQVYRAQGWLEALLHFGFSSSAKTFPQAFFSSTLRIKQSDVDELRAEMQAMICFPQLCLYLPGSPRRGGIHKRDMEGGLKKQIAITTTTKRKNVEANVYLPKIPQWVKTQLGQDMFSFMFIPFLLMIFCSANSKRQFPVFPTKENIYFNYLHSSHYQNILVCLSTCVSFHKSPVKWARAISPLQKQETESWSGARFSKLSGYLIWQVNACWDFQNQFFWSQSKFYAQLSQTFGSHISALFVGVFLNIYWPWANCPWLILQRSHQTSATQKDPDVTSPGPKLDSRYPFNFSLWRSVFSVRACHHYSIA